MNSSVGSWKQKTLSAPNSNRSQRAEGLSQYRLHASGTGLPIPLYIRNKPSLVGFKKAIFDFFKDSYKNLDHFTFELIPFISISSF